jgi:hypothetical protein
MAPKKDGEKHYYGFDSSGLEKAATVSLYNSTYFPIGRQIPWWKSKRKNCVRARYENWRDQTSWALGKQRVSLPCSNPDRKLAISKVQIAEDEKRKTKQFEVEMAKRQAEY